MTEKKRPTKGDDAAGDSAPATNDLKWEKDFGGSRNGRGFGSDGSWEGDRQDDTSTPDGGVDDTGPQKKSAEDVLRKSGR